MGLRQWEEACAAYTKGECKWAGLVGVRWVGGRAEGWVRCLKLLLRCSLT